MRAFRRNGDNVDKLADPLGGVPAAFLVAERQQVAQVGDEPTVFVSETRVQRDNRRRRRIGDDGLGLLQLEAGGLEGGADFGELGSAVSDGAHEPVDLLPSCSEPALGLGLVDGAGTLPVSAQAVEFANELADQLGREQVFGQRVEHALLEQVRLDRAAIRARPALP